MFEYRCNSYLSNAKACHAFSVFAALSVVLTIFNHSEAFTVVNDKSYVEFYAILQSALYGIIALFINYVFFKKAFKSEKLICIPQLEDLVKMYIYASLVTATVILLLDNMFNRHIFSTFAAISYIILGVALHSFLINITYLMLRKINSSRKNKRVVLMVGTNRRAVELAKFFENNDILGFFNLGFIDDQDCSNGEAKLIGHLDQFDDVIRNNVIDFIFIHLPIRSYYDIITSVIEKAECHGIAVHYLTNIFEPRKNRFEASHVGSVFSIMLHSAPIEDWRIKTKRVLDIVLSLLALIVALPIMGIAALIIKLSDGGPVLFTQKRVGYNKRIFNVYKLRTMCVNAEKMKDTVNHLNEMDGPVFKIKNDPRITWIGRILRKFSIDEFPQFFNVLAGDMSIVGPRAMAVTDYQGFSEDWQRRRFSMRPGLTCYWQIRGRNTLPFEEWMRLDMEYIDNWNLIEDFKIMLLTVPEVLRGGGH